MNNELLGLFGKYLPFDFIPASNEPSGLKNKFFTDEFIFYMNACDTCMKVCRLWKGYGH